MFVFGLSFLHHVADSGASSLSDSGSPLVSVARDAAETSCPSVTGSQSARRGSGEPIREHDLVWTCPEFEFSSIFGTVLPFLNIFYN